MAVIVAHAEHGSLAEKKAPVGLVLIPLRFRRQRKPGERVVRTEPDNCDPISIGHRAPRIWWACRGSASRARPSPRSRRSVARYRRSAGRTVLLLARCR